MRFPPPTSDCSGPWPMGTACARLRSSFWRGLKRGVRGGPTPLCTLGTQGREVQTRPPFDRKTRPPFERMPGLARRRILMTTKPHRAPVEGLAEARTEAPFEGLGGEGRPAPQVGKSPARLI